MLDKLRFVKRRLGPLWWYSLCMFCVARVGDLISMYIGVFLVPDVISRERLGAILPLTKLAVLVGAPLSIVLAVALKYIGVFTVSKEAGKTKALLRDLGILSAAFSAVALAYMWSCRGFIQQRLKFENIHVVWLVAAMGIVSCWMPMAHMAVRGLKKFYRLIVSRALRPTCRLVVLLLVLRQMQVTGYLLASVVSGVVVLLFLFWGVTPYVARDVTCKSYRSDLPDMARYMIRVGGWTLLIALQGTVGPWVIRQHLPPADSAGYYLIAMFGNIPLWVAPAMVPFLFPIVSERFERGEDTSRMHHQSLSIALGLGLGITGALFFVGDWLLQLRESWRVHAAYSSLVWQVSLTTALTVVMNCHATHENACKRFTYLRYFVPLVLVEALVLYGVINGWGMTKSWMPPAIWQGMDAVARHSLEFIVWFMLATRLAIALFVAVELLKRHRSSSAAEPCAEAATEKSAD